MKKYIYQKFLLNCNYESFNLITIPRYPKPIGNVQPLEKDYNLFDIGNKYTRKVSLSEMDTSIDTIEDWERFLAKVSELEELIIYADKTTAPNPVVLGYRDATIRAYLYRLCMAQLDTVIYYNASQEKTPS